MKKIFVIQCNPKEHSLKEEYVNAYIETAKNNGHNIKIVNLYDLDIAYLNFSGEKLDTTLTPELKQAQDNILWADQLVFVYPVWCLGIPAIMKAFIERVFQEDVVCKYSEMGPSPLLKDKTAVIMQSYSMPSFFMKYYYGDIPMKWWNIVLTKWCGPKIIKRFDFDMLENVSEKKKQKWIKDIKKFVAKL